MWLKMTASKWFQIPSVSCCHYVVTWTNADLLAVVPLRTNLNDILFKIGCFILKKMHVKNVVCKILAFFFRNPMCWCCQCLGFSGGQWCDVSFMGYFIMHGVVTERKRPPFSRGHFQIDFLVGKLLKLVLNGLTNKITTLVQIIAWRCTYDKPLSEPMMA